MRCVWWRCLLCLFFNDTATTDIYTYLHTLSLHYALPIYLYDPYNQLTRVDLDCRWLKAIHYDEAGRVEVETLFNTLGNYDSVSRMVRSEEHTSELQSLMRISYDVLCLKKKKQI